VKQIFKGGLISESFSCCAYFFSIGGESPLEIAHDSYLAHLWGDWSQSEKNSEIKPPLGG
jgi:hypothetical protein